MIKKSQLLSAAILVLLLGSCKENLKENEVIDHDTPPKTETPIKDDKPLETVKPASTGFGGIWLNRKYVDRLIATQSPKKSQDITPITMLVLPDDFNKEATVIISFHEGATGKVFKKDKGYQINYADSNEPPFSFDLDKRGIKSENDEFVKLKSSGNKNDFRIADQLLFAGKYDLNGKQVEFSTNGKVTGLDAFSYYSVLIDYYDAGMQVDQIRLGKNAEESKLYGFTFKNDTLSIYELKCVDGDADFCDVVKLGKKLYQLKKK